MASSSSEAADIRAVAEAILQSDVFVNTVNQSVEQALRQGLTAMADELTPVREEIVALKSAVRQLIEERESPGTATGAATSATTVPVTAPDAVNTMAATPTPNTVVDTPAPPPSISRQQIPHPEPYDGKQRALFLPWKMAMLAKLRIEGAVIGDAQAQFFYVHNRLKGHALQMVTAYMEEMQRQGSMDLLHILLTTCRASTMTPTRRRKL